MVDTDLTERTVSLIALGGVLFGYGLGLLAYWLGTDPFGLAIWTTSPVPSEILLPVVGLLSVAAGLAVGVFVRSRVYDHIDLSPA